MTEDHPIAVGIRKVSRTARYAVIKVFERRFYFKTQARQIEHVYRTSVITATLDNKEAAITEAKRLSLLLDVPYLGELLAHP